jgi:hypothetical protein
MNMTVLFGFNGNFIVYFLVTVHKVLIYYTKIILSSKLLVHPSLGIYNKNKQIGKVKHSITVQVHSPEFYHRPLTKVT